MILEAKLKKAALMAAIDINMKRINKSPERCVRNLIELSRVTFPDKISEHDYNTFAHQLHTLCKNNDIQGVRELFMLTFLQD